MRGAIPTRVRLRYLWISAGLLLLDQVTKVLAHAHLADGPPREIVPGFFNLTYSRNAGGLFGYMGNLAEPWRTMLLTVVPVVAVGLIVLFLLRTDDMDRPTLLGLSLILGGALGNLIDRVVRGEVVDFLDAYVSSPRLADWLVARFGTAHWPTFNFADSGIVVGAGLLLLMLLRPPQRAAASESRPAHDGPKAM